MTNMSILLQRALNPKQYDLSDLNFRAEGTLETPERKLFWQYIRELDLDYHDKSVLDIASGTGWLLHRIKELGATEVFGIEPAEKNCEIAREYLSSSEFECNDLFSSQLNKKFDFVFLVMASDYFEDLNKLYRKIITFMKDDGIFVSIDPDYEYNKLPRFDYKLEVEELNDHEYVIGVTRPRSGKMVGIIRKESFLIETAQAAGLECFDSRPLIATKDFLLARPEYEQIKKQPIARVHSFKKKQKVLI